MFCVGLKAVKILATLNAFSHSIFHVYSSCGGWFCLQSTGI